MPLTELNHYFVRANDLERDQGLLLRRARTSGDAAAAFPFPGYWLGRERQDPGAHGPGTASTTPKCTTSARPRTPATGPRAASSTTSRSSPASRAPSSGASRSAGVEYQPRSLPEFDLYQIFVKDPNGLTIELNFFGLKDVTDWGGRTTRRCPGPPGGAHDARRAGFAGVTYEEAIARARALVPALRERAERGRRPPREMPKETLDDLHRTGLCASTSRSAGAAWSSTFVALFDIPAEVARGCASTAWNVGQPRRSITGCSRSTTSAPRRRCGATNPDALIASGIAYPAGAGAAGGRRLRRSAATGTSRAASTRRTGTCSRCTVRDGERVVDHRMCLVPRRRLRDRRRLARARHAQHRHRSRCGASDVFVPEHRALSHVPRARRRGVSRRARSIRTRSIACRSRRLGSHCLAGAGVGNAQAALELTIEAITRAQHQLHGHAHARLPGRAAPRRRARAPRSTPRAPLVRADCLEAERIAARGRRARPIEEKLRFKRNVACAMDQCTEAVDIAARAGGRQRHLRPLSDPAPLPRPARAGRATSASAGTPRPGRGRSSRSAASSIARPSERSHRWI